MNSRSAWLGWALLLAASSASALVPLASADALAWLQRIQAAAGRLNYSGTFVYMHLGGQPQTSRITHVFESGNERERLDILDGAPLTILRANEEVRSYSPDTKTVVVEKRSGRGGFPALLTDPGAAIAEQYDVRKGDLARVAGLDCQVVVLESRDRMRYGHRLWADLATGLLLKAQTINERGEVVEQIAFSQVDIGGAAEKYASRLAKPKGGRDWRTATPGVTPVRFSETGWHIENPLPGFRKVLELKRGIGAVEVGQVVFSDGLASVSVFIEPLSSGAGAQEGISSQGAVNVSRRRIGDHLVTVLGEAPPACISRFAQAIEFRPLARR
jgi:sigma-E factor negative regulatory protein RseB